MKLYLEYCRLFFRTWTSTEIDNNHLNFKINIIVFVRANIFHAYRHGRAWKSDHA